MRILKRKEELVQLLFFFFASIVCQCIINSEGQFPYDSGVYVQLSQSFWNKTGFSLLNYGQEMRGIWFPLLLAIPIRINSLWGWRILAAVVTVFFVCYAPRFILFETENQNIFVRRCFLFFLLYLFWPGVFSYPLSDTIALLFLIMGCMLILRKNILGYTVGAAFLYISYNIRTIYLFPIVFFLVGISILYYIRGKKELLYLLTGVFLGAVILAPIPQVIANYNHYRTISIKVITVEEERYPNGLFAKQLAEGLTLSQYETKIGSSGGYPEGGVKFIDSVGVQILEKEQMTILEMSIKDVIKVILKNPFEVIGIYARHFINILNPVWGEVYIKDINKTKIHLTLINYVLLFIMCCFIREKNDKIFRQEKTTKMWGLIRKHGINWICIGSLLTPCLLILPGCVELRFFFPAYWMLYAILLFRIKTTDLKMIIQNWAGSPIRYGGIFIFGLVIICMVCSNTYVNNEAGVWIGFF